MKKRLLVCLTVSLVILLALMLASCGDEDGETPANNGKTVTLNVYNWGEYISDGSLGSYDSNAAFEAYCREELGLNVKVNYTTYATNEDMYAKLSSGAGNYDIVIPSDYMIQRMAEEGMLYAFRPAETVENYQYIMDDFKGKYYDPDELYSVAYTYGMAGIIYNTTMVDEEDLADESWGLLWNEKYKGKILQFNNPRDGLGSAMYYLNIDVNSQNPADWDRALDKLIEQKPLVQAYVSDEIYNKMISGSAAVSTYYAGDYTTMADQNENLAFYYPSEGTNVFVDAMCIPKNAANKELAIEYINFMLSEEPAVANALYIGYACPNSLVLENEDYLDEMGEDAIDILYGVSAGEVNENYSYDPYYHSFTPEIQDYVNAKWETLKTENAVEVWVHVTAAIIVVGVLTLGIYTTYRKKKRIRDYCRRDFTAEAESRKNQ